MGPDGTLIFSDVGSGGVFRFDTASKNIEPVVTANDAFRYADFATHPQNPNWIIAIKEDHTKPLPADIVNTIVLINVETRTTETICQGADFYTNPRFSADGKWISWVQWNHPDMPWTGSELYAAEWIQGGAGKPRYIAGKSGREAIGQPVWHSYGGLMFSSDRTGFFQLYMFDPVSFEVRKIEVKGYEDADLGPMPGLGK
jgi:dipeptidyl aminopeptidase/acylaminoacyl peptidase